MKPKSYLLGLAAALLATSCLAGAPAQASGPTATDAPPVKPGFTKWSAPTAAEPRPQTDAEKKDAQANGRTLPVPELLQPTLDPALPAFQPTPGLKINRSYRAGSSDVLPGLVNAWVEEFRKYQPGFSLEIDKPMAGSLGALELIKGNLDLVFVSRELKPTDVSGFREKFGHDPFSVPISGGSWRHFGFLDSIAFMVHPDNPLAKLDFKQIDAAFSATRHRGGKPVRTWGDLGLTGKWAAKPVHLYGIKPWNGFEEFVRQRVLSADGKRGEWQDGITMDATFFAVARRVAADPYALGYTGLSAVDSEVKFVPISVSDGPGVSPGYEEVASARYPLARLIYFNTNAAPAKPLDPELREFLRFILSREGQAVILRQGIYLPLRANQLADSQTYIAANGGR